MARLLFFLALLSAENCFGASLGQQQSRIINGTVAADGEFPFMVAYVYGPTVQECGATIVNENWVLMAAHCVYRVDVPNMGILAGTNNVDDETVDVTRISECIIHEEFQMDLKNDIALLKLAEPLTFGPKIQAVRLPEPSQQTAAGTEATVIGWGSTEQTSIDPLLRKAVIYVWTDEDCQETYADYSYPLYPSNICAGLPEGGRGQCNGDSGGPLIADGYQIGIVSWSRKPCVSLGSPGVFTEVSYYVDWINEKIGNTSSRST